MAFADKRTYVSIVSFRFFFRKDNIINIIKKFDVEA